MPSERILNLKIRYSKSSGTGNIGKDFLEPCLAECVTYRRGTGYFNSSALRSYVGALDHIINDKVKIEIICSPIIQSRSLIDQLSRLATDEQRKKELQKVVDDIALIAIGYKMNQERNDYRAKLLTYLIANNQLELRFAVPKKEEEMLIIPAELEDSPTASNLYHVKYGYFKFSDATVAFEGSSNETDSGLHHNFDAIQVFRSWKGEGDQERIDAVVAEVDADWEGHNPYFNFLRLSDDAIEIIKQHSSPSRPIRPSVKPTPVISPEIEPLDEEIANDLWPHQRAGLAKFLKKGSGILEMATGTGKTRTALAIISALFRRGQIESVIVAANGTDLLNQWVKEFDKWFGRDKYLDEIGLKLFKHYENFHERSTFLNVPKNSICVARRDHENLNYLLRDDGGVNLDRCLVIHDEVHKFGSELSRLNLGGTHQKVKFRLGLSATPERNFDDDGDAFTKTEIGEVIFDYPLETAIRDGVLCEFEYIAVNVPYAKEDGERKRAIHAQAEMDARNGNPWPKDQLAIKLAMVRKEAFHKPEEFERLLSRKPDCLKNSIVFVATTEQGFELGRIVGQHTTSYKTYFGGDDAMYVEELSQRRIDTLIACERLNEGVDIRSLEGIVLVSSDRGKLDTIQRIGRCIRKDPSNPNKKAFVIDFLVQTKEGDFDQADQERKDWLTSLSEIKQGGAV